MSALRSDEPRRVLLVDDHDDIRLLWRVVLQSAGTYEIREASDGQEAIALVVSDGADIVITDLSMPVTSGYEVVAAVRERCPESVVVVCSALDARDEAMQSGATAFVPKEHSATDLAATVDACIGSL